MIYADINSHEMFIFDKFGDWSRVGVNHPLLGLETNYNEIKWSVSFYSVLH